MVFRSGKSISRCGKMISPCRAMVSPSGILISQWKNGLSVKKWYLRSKMISHWNNGLPIWKNDLSLWKKWSRRVEQWCLPVEKVFPSGEVVSLCGIMIFEIGKMISRRKMISKWKNGLWVKKCLLGGKWSLLVKRRSLDVEKWSPKVEKGSPEVDMQQNICPEMKPGRVRSPLRAYCLPGGKEGRVLADS